MSAPDPAPYRTEDLPYEGEGERFLGHVAHPHAAGPRPCVVLAHDWSGLNRGMKAVAQRVAALGYVAFGIDVYGAGVRGDELGDNSHLMGPLLADRALLRRRLLLGLKAAAAHPAVDPARIAVLGFCFGGLCALDLARADPPELRAAVSVHGVLRPPQLEPRRSIRASVLLLHGWEDPTAPPEDVLAITRELTEAGADWQLHVYGHAMHAFTFEAARWPERGIAYEPRAARRAWKTLGEFLAETFG